MAADMAFEHLEHQAIDRAADGGDLLQDLGARVLLVFEHALDGVELAAQATHAIDQLVLVTMGMGHAGIVDALAASGKSVGNFCRKLVFQDTGE